MKIYTIMVGYLTYMFKCDLIIVHVTLISTHVKQKRNVNAYILF